MLLWNTNVQEFSTCNKYSNRNKANLHWYKCALVQVFKCERQIVALCHQLFKHCIQLSGVTVTTHDIRDVQTELTQS